ncbi:Drosophila melanogaster CG15040 gene product, partial [Plasmodium yoelii yoelii]
LKLNYIWKNKNKRIGKVGTKFVGNIHGEDKQNIEYENKNSLNSFKNCDKKKQNPNNTINGKPSYYKGRIQFDRKNIIHDKNLNKINIQKDSIFHISNFKENKYIPINLNALFLGDDKKKNNLDSELSINNLKKNMRFILKKKNNKKKNNSQISNISNTELDNHMNNSDFEKNEISKTIIKKLNISEKEIKNENKLYYFKNNKENVDKSKHFFKKYITKNQKRKFIFNILNKRILKNKSKNKKIGIYQIEENINYTNFCQIFNCFIKSTNNYPNSKHTYQLVKKKKKVITNQDCDINTKKRLTYFCLFKRRLKGGVKNGQAENGQVKNGQAENCQVKNGQAENGQGENCDGVEKPNLEKNSDNEKNVILSKFNEDPVFDIDDDMLEKYIFKETEEVRSDVLIEFKEALTKHIQSLNILDKKINKIECKSDNEDIIIIGVKIYLYDTYTLLFVYALNSIEYSVKKWIQNNIDKLKLYIKKYNSNVLNFFKTHSINMFSFFCIFLNIIENYIHQFPFYFSISFDDLTWQI